MTAFEYVLSFKNEIFNKKEILTYLIMNGVPITEIKKCKKDNKGEDNDDDENKDDGDDNDNDNNYDNEDDNNNENDNNNNNELDENEESINKLISSIKEKADILLASDHLAFEIEIKKKLNKDNINETDSLGNTLIFYAIENDDKYKVNTLINRFSNININIKNNYHETPLYYALKFASKDIVELLIKEGCNIDIEINNKSMLHYALKRKVTEMKEDNKEIKIREAETESSIALLLMKKGLIDLSPSTINDTVKFNWGRSFEVITQLMYQIIEGNQEKAKKLINSKYIDLTVKDNENCTAYAYAKYKKNAELIRILEEKGCNKDEPEKILKDFFGITNTRTAMSMTGGFLLESFEYLTKNTPIEKIYNLIQSNKIIELGSNFMDDDKKDFMNEMIRYKKQFKENDFLANTTRSIAESFKNNLAMTSGNVASASSTVTAVSTKIALGENQLDHVLDGNNGHLTNTPEHRDLLEEIANTTEPEEDEFGYRWCIKNKNNVQYWVRYQNKSINEGGETEDIRRIINQQNYSKDGVENDEDEITLNDLYKILFLKLKSCYQDNKQNEELRNFLSGMNPYFFDGEGSAIPSIYNDFKNNSMTNSNMNTETMKFNKYDGLEFINNYIKNGNLGFSIDLVIDTI